MDAIQNDWVFFVDADEWVSANLAEEISSAIRDQRYSGYAIRVRLVFQGTWIRFAGWYRAALLVRLVNRSRAHWSGIVSEKLHVAGTIGYLNHDLVNEDLKPFERWLARHNRYSTLKADQRLEWRGLPAADRWRHALQSSPPSRVPREVAKRVVAPRLPAPGLWRFLYMYVVRGGFLHGTVGLRFCVLHAMQEMHIQMKIDEQQQEMY